MKKSIFLQTLLYAASITTLRSGHATSIPLSGQTDLAALSASSLSDYASQSQESPSDEISSRIRHNNIKVE